MEVQHSWHFLSARDGRGSARSLAPRGTEKRRRGVRGGGDEPQCSPNPPK